MSTGAEEAVGIDIDLPLTWTGQNIILETTGHINSILRPTVLGMRQFDLQRIPSWDIITGVHGSLTRSREWGTAQFEWRPLGGQCQNGDQFEINAQRFLDASGESFEIFDGVAIAAGRYWWTRGELQYQTSSGRPLRARGEVGFGRFYSGTNTNIQLDATRRPGAGWSLPWTLHAPQLHCPAGRSRRGSCPPGWSMR